MARSDARDACEAPLWKVVRRNKPTEEDINRYMAAYGKGGRAGPHGENTISIRVSVSALLCVLRQLVRRARRPSAIPHSSMDLL